MKFITGSNRVCASIPWVLPLEGTGQIVDWGIISTDQRGRWTVYSQCVLQMLVDLHNGGLVAAAITVIGRCIG